jgi:hypothetical protein
MSTRPDTSRLRDLAVFAAFWVAAVLLLREIAPASSKGTALAQTVAIGFVLALGGFAIAAVGLRTQFPRVWPRLVRLAYGVLVFIVVVVFFFGGAIIVSRLLS